MAGRRSDRGHITRLRRVVAELHTGGGVQRGSRPGRPGTGGCGGISDFFGEETNTSVMQVVLKTEGGNIFSLDGYNAVEALRETIMNGALADRMAQDRPDPIATFLAPVEFAPKD